MPERRSIVILAGPGASSRAVYHACAARHADVHVVLEQPVPRRQLLSRRLRKLGVARVAGQLLFMTLVLPVLRRRGAGRIEEIRRAYGLTEDEIPDSRVTRVSSVNSPEARAALRALDPAVVVVNGTRIIGAETLAAVDVPFINMHAGITPAFRGVHGGYWALSEGVRELAGTTVHLVDSGIDTGGIIDQAGFTVTPRDSFVTYPYLHTGVGIPLLMQAIERAVERRLETRPGPPGVTSRLWSHPTLWQYLRARLRRGVR